MKCVNAGCDNQSGVHWACDSCCGSFSEEEPDIYPCQFCGNPCYEHYCSIECTKLDKPKRIFPSLLEVDEMMRNILKPNDSNELPF